MYQVIEQTQREKMKMYMKLSKKELAKMLINCNDILYSYIRRDENKKDNSGTFTPIPPVTCYHTSSI